MASERRVALLKAAVNGDYDALKTSLEQGVDVNAWSSPEEMTAFGSPWHEPYTALIRVAARGDTRCLKLLLDHGADMHQHWEYDSYTALQEAAERLDMESLRVLIDYDDPSHQLREEEVSPLYNITHDRPDGQYSELSLEAARLLLDSGFQPNVYDQEGNPVLYTAAMQPDTSMMVLLLEKGADINFPDDYAGYTPLLRACRSQSLDRIDFLIAHGADLTYRNIYNHTALHIAAENNRPHVLKALLRKRDWTEAATDLPQDFHLATVLHAAAARLAFESMKTLVLEENFDVNAREPDTGKTPLHVVGTGKGLPPNQSKLDEAINFLKSHGAKNDIRDFEGNLPRGTAT